MMVFRPVEDSESPLTPSFPPAVKRLPKEFLEQVAKYPQGRPRPEEAVVWFFRFLETGEATQSVLDGGYTGTNPSVRAHKYKLQFQDLLDRALMFKWGWLKPKAMVMFGYAMSRAMAPENRNNPQMLAMGVKAAGELFSRIGVPDALPDERTGLDAHETIDLLVEKMGIEAVRLMKGIVDYKAHRDYLEKKRPRELIEVEASE